MAKLAAAAKGCRHAEMLRWLMVAAAAAQRPTISGRRSAAAQNRRKRWYNCKDPSGQAYGAAWLAHKTSILRHDVSVRDNTNMESGGWLPAKVATPLQSVDLFDCAVEHLSWLERRIGLRDARGKAKQTWDAELLTKLSERAKMLEARAKRNRRAPGPRRKATVAVLPFFATSPECEAKGASCTTGSSAPAMRRHFLNTTYWSIVDGLTQHVVLSTCSKTDAEFARKESGLKWFDVLESECFVPRKKTGVPFFKPALLGAKSIHAIRDKLQTDPRWAAFDYVYYSEADQVLHVRNARLLLSVVDEHTYVSPHRMQPMAHPVDMPSLATDEGRHWLPRWSRDDLDRIKNMGQLRQVPDVGCAQTWRCCVGRSECTGDGKQGDRNTFLPWKVPSPALSLVVYDQSFAMVAAHQGNYGQLLFRGCTLEEVAQGAHGIPEACPPDDGVVASTEKSGRLAWIRERKREKGTAGGGARAGLKCGPRGTCRPDGTKEGLSRAARQVLAQDRYLAAMRAAEEAHETAGTLT